MKFLFLLCLTITLPRLTQAANIAQYCLAGSLIDTKTNVEKSYMRCDVAQKLTWEDFSVLFQCDFDGSSKSIFTTAARLGSDLGASAWTIYDLKNGELGEFLSDGLKLSKVKKSQDIKIMYTNEVWANDNFIVIEDSNGLYKLNLEAYLGNCI